MKKVLIPLFFSLAVSNAVFAVNQSTITIRNYSAGPLQIIVYDAEHRFVTQMPLALNDQIGPYNWVTYYPYEHDQFDSVNFFYPDQGAATPTYHHCGDIPGDTIPLFTTISNLYEVDQCDANGFRWHLIV